jgi:hypothetical protein
MINNLTEKKAEITRLTGERDAITNRVAEQCRTLKAHTKERDFAQAVVATKAATLKHLSTAISESDPGCRELAAEISTLKASATTPGKMAARILGNSGRVPLSVGSDPDAIEGKVKGSLAQQYAAIADCSERAAFFKKHQDKL